MTRPPDDDLGTVEGIVRTVEAMEQASMKAHRWAWTFGPCAVSEWAYESATEAAHHARRLQGVAALLAASWRCPDCAEREGA